MMYSFLEIIAYGQLGLGHNENQNKPHNIDARNSNTPNCMWCCHTIILKENNDVLVFGCNTYGQLGLGHSNEQNTPAILMQGIAIRQIVCGYDHTIILQENNDVLVFGSNNYGQLGLGHNENQNKPQILMHGIAIRQITCGYYHSIILQENNDILVYGNNKNGELGLGYNYGNNANGALTLDYNEPKKMLILSRNEEIINGSVNNAIHQIVCGMRHTIILQENNNVLVFGNNKSGQLGLGHNDNQNKPIILMQYVAQLQGYCDNIKWSPEKHHKFSAFFRNSIYYFLLAHKRNQLKTGLRIPKFVLFEIFKKI